MATKIQLRPVDWGVLGYIVVASGVTISRLGRFPGVEWALPVYSLAAALVLLLAMPGLGQLGRTLRELYPLLLVVLFYGALDLMAGQAALTTHDRTVQAWETALFGGQVSRTWWQRFPSPFWSAALHGVYASYYPVIMAGPIGFLARGDHQNLRRTVTAIAATYGICFLIFMFYPVAGPNYEFPRPAPEFLDNAPASLVYALLHRGSSYGAAFPSSHVAAALVAALVTLRGWRALGLVLLVPSVILPFAVVYTQMHYAVDALAGVVVGLGVYGTARLLERREKRR